MDAKIGVCQALVTKKEMCVATNEYPSSDDDDYANDGFDSE